MSMKLAAGLFILSLSMGAGCIDHSGDAKPFDGGGVKTEVGGGGDDSPDQGGPKPLPEHAVGQDPTSVFLARLVLPATLPATGGRPIRTAAEVVVDNRSRRFVYPPAALARWVGL